MFDRDVSDTVYAIFLLVKLKMLVDVQTMITTNRHIPIHIHTNPRRSIKPSNFLEKKNG